MGEAMLQLLLVRNGNASVPVLMLTRCFFFVGFLLFFFFSPHCLLAAWLAADFVLYHAVMVMHRQSDRDTPFFIYSKFLLW